MYESGTYSAEWTTAKDCDRVGCDGCDAGYHIRRVSGEIQIYVGCAKHTWVRECVMLGPICYPGAPHGFNIGERVA